MDYGLVLQGFRVFGFGGLGFGVWGLEFRVLGVSGFLMALL